MMLIYVLGGVALFGLIWLIATHNRLVSLRNHIRESESGIDVVLRRRHDLIPNLVETVKAYATHESDLFERVTNARNQAVRSMGSLAAVARPEGVLVAALNDLFMRVEAYPDLKANAHFLELQKELANTEDRIAAARRFYNANVRSYNTMIECFPSSIVAGMGSHTPREYFEVESVVMREMPAIRL